ncbi:DMT family transporter [Halomonas beimenensis]|uniref:Permease of the drug/metabolite transporter (DMT) superfamily n=1 Tax=Halomonas beimenensis TaxID=475662 RepID=A0A291P385_9GAMM|nr:DMT family transporter [Halomonas beimenensis]ATJ81341.1 permease of the drug/metabolite transporter (DMT) superfamily [Halomonas beimenensis]
MRLPSSGSGQVMVAGVMPALLAVVLWSLAPLLVDMARSIPPLRLTALALLAGALGALPMSGRAGGARPPLSWRWRAVVFAGLPLLVLGAVGSYLAGLGLAPTAEAALVTYTWPVMFVVLSQWTLHGRVPGTVIGGALVAFSGAALLLAPQLGSGGIAEHLPGYLLALLSGCCWALYSWLCQRAPVSLAAVMPRLFLLASVIAAAASLGIEGRAVMPDLGALVAALALGLGPYGLAMVSWDRALRLGRSGLVGSLAYGVPVLAACFLVIGGAATPDWRLPAAAALVVAGCARASR